MSSDKFLELKDNVCATKEHSVTEDEILLSIVSNANDGEIDTDVVEESMYHHIHQQEKN